MSAMRQSHLNCLSRSSVWGKELCSQGTNFKRTSKHQGEIASLKKELSILCSDIAAQTVKNLPAKEETPVRPLGQEDPLEEGMGESQGQRSLVGCSPRGLRESVTSERLTLSLFFMADDHL